MSMDEANKAPGERLTATLRLGDPRGLHCRVSALLAHRLRVEAPTADKTRKRDVFRTLGSSGVTGLTAAVCSV
jgi:hypothetical protein